MNNFNTSNFDFEECVRTMRELARKQSQYERDWMAIHRDTCTVCGFRWKPEIHPQRLIVCEHQYKQIRAAVVIDGTLCPQQPMYGIQLVING